MGADRLEIAWRSQEIACWSRRWIATVLIAGRALRCIVVHLLMKDVVCAHGLVMFCSLLSVVCCILYAACGRVYHMLLYGSKVSK